MGEATGITWAHDTFNPWEGCTRVSPGCEHCYAEVRNNRWHDGKHWGPHAPRLERSAAYWKQPLKWNREAAASGQPRRVFCASVADVFERLPDGHPQREWMDVQRQRLWDLIAVTPHLTWMLLTKRIDEVMGMVPAAWRDGFPSTVWMGATVEDQPRADKRIPVLRRIPARVRFISVEPQLGPVDLNPHFGLHPGNTWAECLCAEIHPSDVPCIVCDGKAAMRDDGIGWVIQGGESGRAARPFDFQWALEIRRQCADAGVPYFFKQGGDNPWQTLGHERLPLVMNGKGDDVKEWPESLRVQQFPG